MNRKRNIETKKEKACPRIQKAVAFTYIIIMVTQAISSYSHIVCHISYLSVPLVRFYRDNSAEKLRRSVQLKSNVW